jgi:hypothetical protein
MNCRCDHAIYWCHRCGYAYCLDCRSHGEACDHHICNYSSEIGEKFLPDSIAARDSTLSVADLVYDALGQEAYFGAHRAEQPITGDQPLMTLLTSVKKVER